MSATRGAMRRSLWTPLLSSSSACAVLLSLRTWQWTMSRSIASPRSRRRHCRRRCRRRRQPYIRTLIRARLAPPRSRHTLRDRPTRLRQFIAPTHCHARTLATGLAMTVAPVPSSPCAAGEKIATIAASGRHSSRPFLPRPLCLPMHPPCHPHLHLPRRHLRRSRLPIRLRYARPRPLLPRHRHTRHRRRRPGCHRSRPAI